MIGTTHQIKLEKWATSKGANSNNEEYMVASFTKWATVKRIGANRSTSSGLTTINDSLQFIVRFSYDFNPSGNWRVVYDNLKHTVNSIEKRGEKRFYWIILADSKGIR